MTEAENADAGATEARVPTPPAAPPAPPAKRSGGLWGGLLGGVLAAGAGYGLAQYVPNGWPLGDTAALQAGLATVTQDNAALKAQVAELAKTPAPDTQPLMDRIAALEVALAQPGPQADLAPLEARIAALETRMTAIEAMPTDGGGVSSAVIAAQDAAIRQLQAEVQAMQSTPTAAALSPEAQAELKAATDAAASMQGDATRFILQMQATAALGRVQAALDSGVPFATALPALGEVPAVLKDSAETGVPTLAALQTAFPDAARAALEAALQADMGESWSERVTNFLRNQTGARSLTPREGSDPDAVLSRAEAALTAGNVATALTEIATLPEPAQTAMAEWRGKAEQRVAAVDAVAALALSFGQ